MKPIVAVMAILVMAIPTLAGKRLDRHFDRGATRSRRPGAKRGSEQPCREVWIEGQ